MNSTIVAIDISAVTHIFFWRYLKRWQLEDIPSITPQVINETIDSINSFLAFPHFTGQIVPTKVVGLLDHKRDYEVPYFDPEADNPLDEATKTVTIKGYWRTAYLQTPSVYLNIKRARTKDQGKPILYKKGRKTKPGFRDFFAMTLELFHEAGVETFSFPGYEADDVAAAVSSLSAEQPHSIVLISTDKDWLPLAAFPRVTWFCPLSLLLLNKSNVLSYLRTKFSTEILEARHLWTIHKQRKGDSSDSLPCNSPVEVIDLLNPPTQYQLLNNEEFAKGLSTCFEGSTNITILEWI